jgi:nucleotide-binding universal stress UspA family protein
MSYKTILLHLTDEKRVPQLIETAADIAKRNGAHVIAVYAMPPVVTYDVTGFGASYVEMGLQTFRDEAKRIRAAYDRTMQNRSFTAEFRLAESGVASVASTVLEHARAADLIIAGQRDPASDFGLLLDVPDQLAMDAGRPVLMLPKDGKFTGFGKNITLAWNGRRESARAAFDALPFLKAANKVRILWVNPGKEASDVGQVPAAELATALARHSVKAEAVAIDGGISDIGQFFRSQMTEYNSDMLVMGAYGHSRLREFVFGGTTRDILLNTATPVLLSH